MEEKSLRFVGTERFHGFDICYSVIFLACTPKLACVFLLNRAVSDLARKASTSTGHLLLAELPINPLTVLMESPGIASDTQI